MGRKINTSFSYTLPQHTQAKGREQSSSPKYISLSPMHAADVHGIFSFFNHSIVLKKEDSRCICVFLLGGARLMELSPNHESSPPTAGGVGGGDGVGGSSSGGPSSSAAGGGGTPQTPSRYEAQKRRDWNTFGQYLRNHRPPLSLAQCSGAHVLEFLRYLDHQLHRLCAHARPEQALSPRTARSRGKGRRLLYLALLVLGLSPQRAYTLLAGPSVNRMQLLFSTLAVANYMHGAIDSECQNID
ncbi:hypothetical protein ABZP36_023444 [Zizania latifolia]